MDNFTLISLFFKVFSYLCVFSLNFLVLPLYLSIYVSQLSFYIIFLCYKKIINVNIYPFQSFRMSFPHKLSLWCFVKVIIYTPRYVAYCTIISLLKLDRKKIKLAGIYIFIFVRIWVYFTGIPIFLLKLTEFYKQLFTYMWLYYNYDDFGMHFLNKLNFFFKKKIKVKTFNFI